MMKDQKSPGASVNEIYKLVKENNKMLKSMRRDAVIGRVWKVVWFLAIFIVIPYLLYVFYLEPYLVQVQNLYNNVNESAGTLNSAANDLQELQNSIPNFGDFFGGGQ